MDGVRAAVLAIVVLLTAAGCGGGDSSGGASEGTSPEPTTAVEAGLPGYTAGYEGWELLNDAPFDTPGAHNGVKNVYASAARDGGLFPDETVIVKSIQPEGETGRPFHVAVMRKVDGEWEYVEYERDPGGTYGVLAQGSLCQSCHMQVEASDFVFTGG